MRAAGSGRDGKRARRRCARPRASRASSPTNVASSCGAGTSSCVASSAYARNWLRNSRRPWCTSSASSAMMIGEEHEARGRGELLAHEQHRRLRAEQRQRHQRSIAARRGIGVRALAEKRIADLVMVLQKDDRRFRRQSGRGLTARLLLPRVALTLIEKAAAHARDELLRATGVVAEVPVARAGQGDLRGVMEVVVPHRVETEAAALGRQQLLRVLRLVLGDHDDRARLRRFACDLGELLENVRLAVVEDRLRRVQAQAVEVKLAQPIARVAQNEIARALRRCRRPGSALRPIRSCAAC